MESTDLIIFICVVIVPNVSYVHDKIVLFFCMQEPIEVSAFDEKVVEVSAGNHHSCAVTGEQKVQDMILFDQEKGMYILIISHLKARYVTVNCSTAAFTLLCVKVASSIAIL